MNGLEARPMAEGRPDLFRSSPTSLELPRIVAQNTPLINPFTGTELVVSHNNSRITTVGAIPAAALVGKAIFPEGMNTKLSTRDLFKRSAVIGLAATGVSSSVHPRETMAKLDPFANIPSVEPTPEAKVWTELSFEKQVEIVNGNREGFRRWIEEEGGADDFHAAFSGVRSEIQQAMTDGLTPPELASDISGAITNVGPYAYPADYSNGQAKEDKFFGKVAFARVPNGHGINDRLVIGGDVDAIIHGLTLHDITSETGAEGKVVVLYFGGVNEGKVWDAAGFFNVIWPNGEFRSRVAQFRVEEEGGKMQRVWPYDIPGEVAQVQDGQAGINQMVDTITTGMASLSIGNTFNYDVVAQQMAEQGFDLSVIAPEFQGEKFAFGPGKVGLNLLKRLQLHAANALVDAQATSGRVVGIAQYGVDNVKQQDYDNPEGILSLFPDATDPDMWPSVKSPDYFLARKRLKAGHVYMLPNILGPKRFAYPSELPNGFTDSRRSA